MNKLLEMCIVFNVKPGSTYTDNWALKISTLIEIMWYVRIHMS